MDSQLKRLKGVSTSHSAPSWVGLQSVLAVATLLLLTACGGGGGNGNSNASGNGGQVNNSSVTMSISTQSVAVSATMFQPAPTASFQVYAIGRVPGLELYVLADYSQHGISNVTLQGNTIIIQFKSPATLGAGTYQDSVKISLCFDQACNQQVSNSPQTVQVQYTVTKSTAILSSISPTSVAVGGPPFVLTALGTAFTDTSTVEWNGVPLSTTLVSSTELIAQVPMNNISATGTSSVAVFDPNSSPATTNAQTITIAPPSKDAVAFQINPAHTGAVTFNSVSFPASAKWSVNVGGTPSYALIVEGKVIVTIELSGGSSEVLALDQATGDTAWGPILLSGVANASYDNGRVFVLSGAGANDSTLQAFDIDTGGLDWSTQIPQFSVWAGVPVAADGTVYVGSAGDVYAIAESNGVLLWTENLGGTNISPSVTVDGVYASYSCQASNFRPATGEVIWQFNAGCEGGGSGIPTTANQLVYAAGGQIFNAETGANEGDYTADTPPAFSATMGYFLQGGTLRGVTLSNNTVQWSFSGDGDLIGSPIVVNQYVLIGSSSGNLYALDSTTGAQVWNINLGAAIGAVTIQLQLPFSGLAAGDGLLIVPSGTNVTAYTLSTNP